MTKEEYLIWKPKFEAACNSGERIPTELSVHCAEADALIKKHALKAADKRLSNYTPRLEHELIMLMLRTHFGSAEIDAYLTETKAYPEWM